MEIYDEKEYQCMIIIIKMLYTYSGIKNILIESDQWTDDLKELEKDIEHIRLCLILLQRLK